jgi:hypothetical protein
MSPTIDFNFPHTAPDGYSYEFEEHNTRLIAIWLCHHNKYSYTQKTIRSIWGFYNPKKKEYYAPLNFSKCGDKVNIKDTRNYTAMPIKQTSLEKAFV